MLVVLKTERTLLNQKVTFKKKNHKKIKNNENKSKFVYKSIE